MIAHRRSRGFTLVEIVVVIAVLGILAAIAFPTYVNLVRRANEGVTQGALGAWRSAIAIAYVSSAQSGVPTFPKYVDVQNNICGTHTCFANGPSPRNALINDVGIDVAPAGPCVCAAREAGKAWYYNESTGVMGAGTDNCAITDPCLW